MSCRPRSRRCTATIWPITQLSFSARVIPPPSGASNRITAKLLASCTNEGVSVLPEWIAWAACSWLACPRTGPWVPANLLDLQCAGRHPRDGNVQRPIFWTSPATGRREAMDFDPSRDVPNAMISRFASSAAHVAGHPLASSETFRPGMGGSISAARFPKPSPRNSINCSWSESITSCFTGRAIRHPTRRGPAGIFTHQPNQLHNTIWHDLPAMNEYITRCQSVLQGGQPDNDVLLYWPVFDLWNSPEGMNQNLVIGAPDEKHRSRRHGNSSTIRATRLISSPTAN